MKTAVKKRFPENTGYHPKTRLEWWGTIIGDNANDKFMVAAPTRIECVAAAKAFCPEAVVDHIQSITIIKR